MKIPTKQFVHSDSLQLGGGVTIDTATGIYDNGFLTCARTGWNNPKADSTYDQAANNLSSYSLLAEKGDISSKNLNNLVLVGHGNSGLISTGDGMSPRTATGFISAGRYTTWSLSFARIRGHGIILTLCGCDCGADPVGAQFLYQLATLLNMPVRGRTGLVFLTCPGATISYENGSVWLVAQPGVLPNPIPKPTVNFMSPETVWLNGKGHVPLRSVRTVSVRWSSGQEVVLSGDDVRAFLDASNMDRYVEMNAAPAAIVTATFQISGEHNGHHFDEAITVYNDRLLQPVSAPDIFYLASPGFAQQLYWLRGSTP